MSKKTVFEIATEMLKEADDFETDTMVSMAEGVCNERIALLLRQYGKEILEADSIENTYSWDR